MVSRRGFLRSSAGWLAAPWSVSPSSVSAGLFRGFLSSQNPGAPTSSDIKDRSWGGRKWTPLDQALNRFFTRAHRFPSERRLDLLSASMARLRNLLEAGAGGLEEFLSPRFRGLSVTPQHEKVPRQDHCFDIRVAKWDARDRKAQLSRPEFSADLRRFLSSSLPLSLADLECLEISGLSEAGSLRTRIRFELASEARATPNPESRTSNSEPRRWQASGEWEIEWEAADWSLPSGARSPGSVGIDPRLRTPNSEPASSDWRVVAWRPVEMITVLGPAVVFTDVTALAFGQDPSYKSHLLRDTNYWRAVLDKAAGIDIFGNCGISVGDADGDGKDEIYLCQPQGLPNRLYRQRQPGIFEDVAGPAGVDLLDNTSMALFADVLNRGRQDLIVITESSPLLFLNDGRGRFTLSREAFPPPPRQAALTGAAMADYDNDGYLDLYVCAYAYFRAEGGAGIPIPFYDAHNGPPNRLYRNRGEGTFVDVTTASGLDRGNDRFSFACAWHDIDDDGWPDLAVVNDFGRNNLYRNHRDGTFEEVEEGLPGYGSGMSAAFADWDGDGEAEFYTGNMWSPAGVRVTGDADFQRRFSDVNPSRARQFAMGNALYKRAGSRESGVGEASPARDSVFPARYSMLPQAGGADRGRWAWCSDGFDLENDGRPDIYVVNGFLSSPAPELPPLDAYLWEEVLTLSPHSNIPASEYLAAWTAIYQLAHQGHPWNGNERNVFFLNLGDGHFADLSAAAGLDFRDDGRSFAVFDYDGDGDADLVIHNRTGPQLRLLRNDLAHSNHSLTIRLTGRTGNRDAVGARLEIETPAGLEVRFLNCGSGFLAQHSKELVVGLGPHAAASSVRVRWPGGATSEYPNLQSGYRYHFTEGQPAPRRESLAGRAVASLAVAGNAGFPTAEGQPAPRRAPLPGRAVVSPAVAEPPPARFSTALVEPLPLPLPKPLAGPSVAAVSPPPPDRRHYTLLWLWDPTDKNPTDLQTFLQAQKQIPSRLILWRTGGAIPPSITSELVVTPWQADSRFRLFCSTLLAHLFDYHREPVLPAGLMLELGEGLYGPPALRPESRTAKLVKIYWGGAEAEEILRDARNGVRSSHAALPFPGRAILCSFGRDTRDLGAALTTAGLFPEAEMYLALAVEKNPQDADVLYNLALVRRERGMTAAALAGVRAALAVRREFPQAENLLGIILSQSGRHADAQEHLERATRRAPDFVEAWNNLGYLYLLRGDLPAARTALERALALAPDFPDALDNLGILLARQGDGEKAVALFHRVLALQPDNEQAANNLGVLYAREGKTQEAVETFQSLLAHNPEAPSALLNLVRLDISLRKTDEARSLLRDWLARHSDDSEARKLLQQLEHK